MTHKFSELYNKMPLESRANVEQRVAAHKGELERKIIVPLGMWEAASGALADARGKGLELTTVALEAALKWLGENPIVPTREWLAEQLGMCHVTLLPEPAASRIIAEWQRRMFIASDPDEEIKDLLFSANLADSSTIEIANNKLRDAYRRGLKKRKVGE